MIFTHYPSGVGRRESLGNCVTTGIINFERVGSKQGDGLMQIYAFTDAGLRAGCLCRNMEVQ